MCVQHAVPVQSVAQQAKSTVIYSTVDSTGSSVNRYSYTAGTTYTGTRVYQYTLYQCTLNLVHGNERSVYQYTVPASSQVYIDLLLHDDDVRDECEKRQKKCSS